MAGKFCILLVTEAMDEITVSKALSKSFGDIVIAISNSEPLKVAVDLFSASLISQETLSKILTVQATPLANSTTLVLSVLDQVKVVPDKLETFMFVLKKLISESSYYSKFITAPLYTPGVGWGGWGDVTLIWKTVPHSKNVMFKV